MGYVVTAPLVITRGSAGSQSHDLYLYAGAGVPAHVTGKELQRLIDGQFVEEVPEDKPEPKAPAKQTAPKQTAAEKAAEAKAAAEKAAADKAAADAAAAGK